MIKAATYLRIYGAAPLEHQSIGFPYVQPNVVQTLLFEYPNSSTDKMHEIL